MRNWKTDEWNTVQFTDEQIEAAALCLLNFYDTNLMYLLNNLYTVTEEKDVINSKQLDQRIQRDWIKYLTTDGEVADDKMYKIAKAFTEMEGIGLNSDDISERSAYWKNIIVRLLNMELNAKERGLVLLINEYILCVGKEGIVGELRQFLKSKEDVSKKMEELCKDVFLHRVFKLIRINWADLLEKTTGEVKSEPFMKTVENECQIIFYLLMKMCESNEFSKKVSVILEGKSTGCEAVVGTNLGLEEQQLIFMQPETLQFFETTEGELSYTEIEEIADFLFFYYKTMADRTFGEGKTNRGIKERISFLKSKDDLNDMIRLMLSVSAKEYNFRRRMESIDNDIRRRSKKETRLKLRFSIDEYEAILKKWMLNKKTADGALQSFLKIRIASVMGMKNLMDFLKTMINVTSNEDVKKMKHYTAEVKRLAEFSYSLVMVPTESWKVDDIYERFSKSLARNIELQRYKNCEQVWLALMRNYYDIQPWGAICRRPIVGEDVESILISEMSDKNLALLLRGKVDSQMKKKRENVIRIIDWLNQTGIFQLNHDQFSDFKSVYDVLYTFDTKTLEKSANVVVKINDFKNVKIDPEMYSEDQKMYLVLGVFLAVIYNRKNVSDGMLYVACECVRDVIRQLYDYFDIVNHDAILILLNSFRGNWASALEKENM